MLLQGNVEIHIHICECQQYFTIAPEFWRELVHAQRVFTRLFFPIHVIEKELGYEAKQLYVLV